jgi:hypothetical protein
MSQPYEYKVSSIKMDMMLGSTASNKMLASLKDVANEKVLLTEVIKCYVSHHFNKVYWIIAGLALWHTIFVILLTIQITEEIMDTGFIVFLLIYNITFTLYELPEMALLKL